MLTEVNGDSKESTLEGPFSFILLTEVNGDSKSINEKGALLR
jgi:hypothetical protein